MKINSRKNKEGFTLIELLIVIAIIGILSSIILVALKSARQKSLIASWKSSVSSSFGNAVMCCSAAKNLLNVAGQPMCDGESEWPETDKIGNIVIDTDCSSTDSLFQYTITSLKDDINANCNPAVCNQDGCAFPEVSGHKC